MYSYLFFGYKLLLFLNASVCLTYKTTKDTVKKVRELAYFIAYYNGGYGAVRDFIEWLVDE